VQRGGVGEIKEGAEGRRREEGKGGGEGRKGGEREIRRRG